MLGVIPWGYGITLVKTATFNSRVYKIDIDPDGTVGMCDQFDPQDRWLHIFTDLNTKKGIITTIHEALHAEDWKESEERIDQISEDIGRFLWRLGYRAETEE